jgi:hypothetical protein
MTTVRQASKVAGAYRASLGQYFTDTLTKQPTVDEHGADSPGHVQSVFLAPHPAVSVWPLDVPNNRGLTWALLVPAGAWSSFLAVAACI